MAATWVAGTGAFLMVAAAALFVAVQWDRLPEAAKLALVGALTGGFLAGGRLLRRTLPATGDVLFHLGAFLLPVDLAGLGLRAGAGWRAILLSEGALGTTVLGGLAATSGSVVLAWAAIAAMGALALGMAAVSPVPAAVPLVAAGLIAARAGWRRPALAWSCGAALAPVLGFAAEAVVASLGGTGAGVLAELGAGGSLAGLVAGLAGAGVVAAEARARRDHALAALAVGAALAGVVTTWAGAGIDGTTTVLALPVAFFAVEAAAALYQQDPFWRPLAGAVALMAEMVAGVVGGLWVLGLVAAAPVVEVGLDVLSDAPPWSPAPTPGASLAVLAAAWLVAGARRSPWPALPTVASTARAALGHPVAGPLAAMAAVAAVEVGTASGLATAAALVAVGAGLVWTGATAPLLAGSALAAWTPMAAAQHHDLAAVAGLAGAAVVTLAARVAARDGAPSSVLPPALALLATGTAALGTLVALPVLGASAALLAFTLQAWLVAAVLDGCGPASAHVARAGLLAGLMAAVGAPSGDGLAAALAATGLLALDAVRLGRPRVGVAAAGALQVLVGLLAEEAGFAPAETGMVLVLGAVVCAGLAAVMDGEWRLPFLAAAGMGVAAGLGLASGDRLLLADAVAVSGGLVVAAGIVSGREPLAHVGGAAVCLGVIAHLDAISIAPLEPYVAPVAAHLTLAGWHARRTQRLSSWVAYGPAVALLGGAALVERLAGGPSWHAVVAGVLGVAAVAAGGWRRLAGPLLLGTGLLVAVTVLESLATLAGVPTWGWLAAGGALLLGVGVALERADASPAEAGRRLVDVIAERFE